MAAAVKISEDDYSPNREKARSNYNAYISQVRKYNTLSEVQERELAIMIQSARDGIDDQMFSTQLGRGMLRGIETNVAAGKICVSHVLVSYGLVNDAGREEVRNQEYERFMQAIRHERSAECVRSKLEFTLLNESLRLRFCERMAETLARYVTLCEMSTTTPVLQRQERSYLEDFLGVPRKYAHKEQGRFRQLVGKYKQLKNEMIIGNLSLVVNTAMKYRQHYIILDDIIQEGNLGLMKAVERFDVRKGNKFSTYAFSWIKQAMTRAIADKGHTISIPVRIQDKIRRIDDEERAAMARGEDAGYVQSHADDGKVKNLMRARQVSFTVSLNHPRINGDSESDELIEFVRDESATSPEDYAISRESEQMVAAALNRLNNSKEVEVLLLRFSKGMKLKEVGELKHLSRERIRQIQEKALANLRKFVKYDLGGLD